MRSSSSPRSRAPIAATLMGAIVSAIQPMALDLPAPIRRRQSMSTPSAIPRASSRPLTGAGAPSAKASAAGTMQTPTWPPPVSCVPSSSQQRAITPLASAAIGAATRPPWPTNVLPVPPPYRWAMRAIPRPAGLELPASAAPAVSSTVIFTASTTRGERSSKRAEAKCVVNLLLGSMADSLRASSWVGIRPNTLTGRTAEGLADREHAERAGRAARDQRAQRDTVGLGRVHARALRKLAGPGEIQEQADQRLEQGSRARHHPVDEPDRRAAEPGRVVLLDEREPDALGRPEEARQEAQTAQHDHGQVRDPDDGGERQRLQREPRHVRSLAAADAIGQPAEERRAGAPAHEQHRGQRGGGGPRQPVGRLDERHAPEAREAEERRRGGQA